MKAVFFHGYGANAQDLSFFCTLLPAAHCQWVFPNGPLPVASIPGGRAWFPLDTDEQTGHVRLTDRSSFYLEKHCKQHLQLLNPSPSDRLILGGFSQGAVMALNLALRLNPPPLGLVIMSGALFPLSLLSNPEVRAEGGSFFQCHGRQDTLIPYTAGQETEKFLHSLNWQGRLNGFEGGHEIPPAVLDQVQAYMKNKL